MKYSHFALVGNGNISSSDFEEIRQADYVIAADRAAYILIQKGIIPNIAVGDFDSVSKEEMVIIHDAIKDIRMYPAEKNKTDLELAIDVAQSLFSKGEMFIFGALGGRIDHVLGNIGLLEHCHDIGIPTEIVDEQSRTQYITTMCTIKKDGRYPYLSVIPVGRSASVTMQGVQYSVDHKIFYRSSTLGISNRITSKEAVITAHKGSIVVINSRD